MTFGENPEGEYIRKEGLSMTPERIEEICNKYAETILATSGAQVIIALFSGAMANEAQNSLGQLMQEQNLEHLLPNLRKHLDNLSIPKEFYIGTLRAVARKLEAQHLLRD